jgi:hypothetical protein
MNLVWPMAHIGHGKSLTHFHVRPLGPETKKQSAQSHKVAQRKKRVACPSPRAAIQA